MPPIPADPSEPVTVVEILACYNGHPVTALSINGYRVLGTKCCGRWKATKTWIVPRATLAADLDKAIPHLFAQGATE